MEHPKRVVFTGGPCGGKSTILSMARQRAEDCGFDVYVASEVATFLIEAGMLIKSAVLAKDWDKVRRYQSHIINFQYQLEEQLIIFPYIEKRNAVILHDRGIPDSRAYLPEGSVGDDIYENLVRRVYLSTHGALERYAGVIKMTTAADGAEAFYTCENNGARDESPEVARYLDKRIEEAYIGHPHLIVVDNSTDFEGKKQRALQALCRILGIPEPLEIERKFEVESPCFAHFPKPFRVIEIEQVYLRVDNPKEEARIRKRTYRGSSTYYLTKKREIGPVERIETEEMIDWETYYRLLDARDTARGIIKKDRVCFLWRGYHFELDIFKNLRHATCVLEVEIPDVTCRPDLPPFLKVLREVTEDSNFKNHALALQVTT